MRRTVRVSNMTSLFSKDMLIYSFFDIRLKQPLRIVGILYFLVLFILFGIPILVITWPINVYSMVLTIGGSFGGAYAMSKPIWNGKSFFSFMKTQINYFRRPKTLYDWKKASRNTKYAVESEIIVSRHDDYNELYELVREEEDLKYG